MEIIFVYKNVQKHSVWHKNILFDSGPRVWLAGPAQRRFRRGELSGLVGHVHEVTVSATTKYRIVLFIFQANFIII